jgi:membrane-associated protein
MELIQQGIDIFLHLDAHLNELAGSLGGWLYLVLFLIVFCETGLVVAPFLPGDSLLFAVGALAAIDGSPLDLSVILVLLTIGAIAGDAVNYAIGFWVGPKVFTSETSRLINKQHLMRTEAFYEKYGGKTIILARFMPIIRTFAPFVAGIGRMRYARFALFNVVGGVTWVAGFTLAGYWFGNLPFVKRYFHFVILAIIVISVMPPVIEYLRIRREEAAAKRATPAAE